MHERDHARDGTGCDAQWPARGGVDVFCKGLGRGPHGARCAVAVGEGPGEFGGGGGRRAEGDGEDGVDLFHHLGFGGAEVLFLFRCRGEVG